MTYRTTAAAQQDKATAAAIDALLARYQPGRPCIVFLPGGMASELQCSTSPYQRDAVDYDFTNVWVSAQLLRGAVLKLAMVGGRTVDDALVIAPSAVGIADFEYYVVLRKWAEINRFNLLTLAYDWRLSNAEVADQLDQALETLDARLIGRFGAAEALAPRLHMLAHSLGGIILKLYLNRDTRFVHGMQAAITVGSPFYGYGGQLPRWFNGMSLLNKSTSATAMARLVATLPGPYMLPFLDPASFAAQAALFAADPDAPISTYPVTVAGTSDAIDAYGPDNPLPPGKSWYPPQGWVSTADLDRARDLNEALMAPLPAAIAAKFYNFRGIQAEAGLAVANTVTGLTWAPVTADFDPDTSPSPITDEFGLGDDTIPAWSARLLSLPAANIQTFIQPLEHAFLLDVPDILEAIRQIVSPVEAVPADTPLALRPAIGSISREGAIAWLEQIGGLNGAELANEIAVAGYDGPLRRIFADMLKR